MFKSCFFTLASIASLNLIGLSAEESTNEQVKEVQASTQHLNQEKLEVLVKSIFKDSGKKWKLRTKVEGKKGNSAVYIPEEQSGNESFGVFVGEGNRALSVKSEQIIQDTLEKLHPGSRVVDFRVIKKDDQSLFAEWTIENISDPDLKSHSWIHGINCDEGLVILQYSNDMDKVDEARKTWEPLLEHASLK
ncbi:MAG TPA: hypothetical protein VLG49_07730 [Rhabdochlamydiaceae bacterium]|nr:hypothetical protein [Rhabdochlamydiaceae bacterium]